ncbi:hypothetical protein AUO94_17065 [Planococcus kocurii]|uniref:Uncharacterized protein n=1 Tax=Planococcus kocurii TaxID=1374 RepID=A0ABM5XAE4_9BACL|nr:hypothetical protein AUO94_17065 [Planococcus kocurii]
MQITILSYLYVKKKTFIQLQELKKIFSYSEDIIAYIITDFILSHVNTYTFLGSGLRRKTTDCSLISTPANIQSIALII